MNELERGEFGRAWPVFAGTDWPAVRSILGEDTPGRVFVDDPGAPRGALVYGYFNFAYVAGDSTDPGWLDGLLHEILFPSIRASADPSLVLYPISRDWGESLRALCPAEPLFPVARRHFRFDPARFAALGAPPVPEGIRLARIDAGLLAAHPPLAGEVTLFWRRAEDYLARGVGVCALAGEALAGWCLSIFAPDARRELTIATQPDFRRQGIGTLTATAYIRECLAAGLEPVWECWADNGPSDSLARKLGFVPVGDRPAIFVDLAQRRET